MMRRRGCSVVATDLVARGFGRGGRDFLQEPRLLAPTIVTNPPFTLWLPFARHALALGCDKLVLLGTCLMKEGRAIGGFMQETKLARMVQPIGRVKMRPPGAPDSGYSPRQVFCWYVWERGHAGDPTHHWYEVRPEGAPVEPRKAGR